MRISNIAIALSAALGSALVLQPLTGAAQAVQDRPVTIGGIETVCTGVGSAKDNRAWKAYPVKLVFATAAGEDLAAVHVAVMQGGKPLVESDCDAPWLLMKLPAGKYSIAARVQGDTGARAAKTYFATEGGTQQTVIMTLPGK